MGGGCLQDGSVPLKLFVSTLRRIKKELGLTVFVHTGIVDHELANKLKIAGIDAALIDIIGSEQTIHEVYNLRTSVESYDLSLKFLKQSGMNFIPHLVVGLHYGELRGESHAIDVISSHTPSALVILSFIPIHGTKMANVNPPKPIDIARAIAVARLKLPRTPLILGCMRPKGDHRSKTDILAVKAGVDGIAFPSEEVIDYTKRSGFRFSFSSACCANIYRDIL